MKRERITGFVLCGKKLEWTTLRQLKTGVETVSSGSIILEVPEGGAVSGALIAESLKRNGIEYSPGAAVTGVTSANMLMKIIRLPTTDPEEMDSMIRLQADKLSPFPEDKIEVGYETLSHDESGVSVLMAVLPKDAVAVPGALLEGSGFSLHRIDVNALAWWRLLHDASAVPVSGRHLMLALTDAESFLIAAQNGEPVAFRFLAEQQDLQSSESISELMESIASLLLALDLEHEPAAVSSFDIWGSGEDCSGVLEKLQEELQVKAGVKRLDTLPRLSEGLARRALLDFPANPRKDKLFKGTRAVMDFMPQAWRMAAETKQRKKMLIYSSAAVIACWITGLSVFLLMFNIRTARLEKIEADQMETELASKEVREMRDRVTAFERYLSRSESALECLREISAILPPGMELGGFQYRKGRTLTLRGESLSVNPIYEFKEAMDNSNMFGAVTMGTIRPIGRDGATLQTVQIIAEMAGDDS